jgi:glucose dehydrogenase
MRPIFRVALAAALVAVVAPAAAADGTPAAPAFTAAQLAAAPTDSWLTNGGSLCNQRFSALTLLNRSNVGRLKANWRASLNGSGLSPGRATRPSRSYLAIPSTS